MHACRDVFLFLPMLIKTQEEEEELLLDPLLLVHPVEIQI
jgi:hypothetical protein